MPALETTPTDDLNLLTRFATSGDEKAFATLMQRHWGFVFAIARRSLTNTALAEDATQQTFITLAKKAKSLHKNRPLGPWLYRTAIHEASNLRRREMRHQKRNRDYQALSQPESNPETQLSGKLHQALSSLAEKDRQLIILRYYQNLTADQIADQLQISPAAAQRRTHRALERLSTLANAKQQDKKSFVQALPVLLAPSFDPPPASLSKIAAASGKSSGLFIPTAGWLLATTLSVATVKQVVPPPPVKTSNIPEESSPTRVTSQRKLRSTAKPLVPPRDQNIIEFIRLARNSPAEALEWCHQKYPSSYILEKFLSEATKYLVKTDVGLVEKILAATDRKTLRTTIIKEIFEKGFLENPTSKVRWIESLPHKSDYSAIHSVGFSFSFYPAHLSGKLEESLAIATQETVRLWIVLSLCEIYENFDEVKILDLAHSLEGRARKEALAHFARIQLDRDHPQASEIINQLEGKIEIDANQVIQRAPARYLDAVLPWLPDPDDYQSISVNAGDFLKHWVDYDPVSARQWFQNNQPGKKFLLNSQTVKSLTQSER